jgi:uncharacterized delta-60 repeat protein
MTRRRCIGPVAVAALVLVGVAGAAPGDLDPSFGDGGIVTTSIGTFGAEASSLVRQEDGKLVAAGWVWAGSQSDFALVRYRRNGALDKSFGLDGIARRSFSDQDRANALAIQADGKLVAAGTARVQPSVIVRYTRNGNLDTSFDGDGIVRPDFEFQPFALAVQADGKIVAAGLTYQGVNGRFALLRLDEDGSVDETFGDHGVVVAQVGRRSSTPYALVVQADGKLVAAGRGKPRGTGDTAFALARFNPDGSLDPTFGGDGKVITKMGPDDDRVEGLAIQPDGKVVAAGWTGFPSVSPVRIALARYNADGTLDASFSGDGKVITAIGPADYARDVVVQPDGTIVAAGESSRDFALVRFNPDGTLDDTFGGDGWVTTSIGSDDAAYGLILQPDGKLVAAGNSVNSSTGRFEFALARYDG